MVGEASEGCEKNTIPVVVQEKETRKLIKEAVVELGGAAEATLEGCAVEFKENIEEGDYTIKVTFEDTSIYITPEEEKEVTVEAGKRVSPVIFRIESKREFSFSC